MAFLLNIPSLWVKGKELLNNAKVMSPQFQLCLKEVLQGGLALAQSDALPKEHMENTQAAEQAQSGKQSAQNRCLVQKTGVLYASEGHPDTDTYILCILTASSALLLHPVSDWFPVPLS